MTLPQLAVVSGLAALVMMTMGAGGLLILFNLNGPSASATSSPAEAAQLPTATAGNSAPAFPTFQPTWTPTFTATATNTSPPTLTHTPTLTRTSKPSATETLTSTLPPSETPFLTWTPRPSATHAPTLPVAPTNPSTVGDFQYQFSYQSNQGAGVRGPIETFGSGSIRLKWTYTNAPQQGFFRIVVQRQYDEEVYILEDVVGNNGSGQVDFHLPASGDYMFVVDTLAESWRIDFFFKSG